MIDQLFTKTGAVNTRLLTRPSVREFLENNTKDLDPWNPSLSHRAKYLRFPPVETHCTCGKPLVLSPSAGKVFKTTCGSPKCSRARVDNSNLKGSKTPAKFDPLITRQDIKEFVTARITAGDNPSYITAQIKSPEIVALRHLADTTGKKYIQLMYDIIHDTDSPVCECGSGIKRSFVSFSKGYHDGCDKCRAHKSPRARERNKIEEISSMIDENQHKIIASPPINANPWEFECVTCGTVFQKWMKNGRTTVSCPVCFPVTKSAMEYELIDEIREYYKGEVIHTKRLDSTLRSVDIFVPGKSLAIELNGLYWHSDGTTRHHDKMIWCRDNGVRLIQFTDDDFKNRRDIVSSMIRNALGCNTEKVYARQTTIKSISAKDYRNFCDENHIHGYAAASMKFGAFHENNLVSVFSLSQSRFKKGELELIRFCTRKGMTVVGGLGKFLSHVEKNGVREFITFADLHYGTGNAYARYMTSEGVTVPSYRYFWRGTLHNRLRFQKHRLEATTGVPLLPGETEKAFMGRLGISRYYDCGHAKFRWHANQGVSLK